MDDKKYDDLSKRISKIEQRDRAKKRNQAILVLIIIAIVVVPSIKNEPSFEATKLEYKIIEYGVSEQFTISIRNKGIAPAYNVQIILFENAFSAEKWSPFQTLTFTGNYHYGGTQPEVGHGISPSILVSYDYRNKDGNLVRTRVTISASATVT